MKKGKAANNAQAGKLLMAGINHRFRNNLQLIISLINSQAQLLHNPDVKKELDKIQQRVSVLALAFDQLHSTESLSALYILPFIKSLLTNLQQSYLGKQVITWHIEVDALKIAVTHAIPIGLIIHEAVSNALLHAFAATGKGHIHLRCTALDNNGLLLIIADDGIGFKQPANTESTQTFGFQLITGLSRQLGGSYQCTHENGVQITIIFDRVRYESAQT